MNQAPAGPPSQPMMGQMDSNPVMGGQLPAQNLGVPMGQPPMNGGMPGQQQPPGAPGQTADSMSGVDNSSDVKLPSMSSIPFPEQQNPMDQNHMMMPPHQQQQQFPMMQPMMGGPNQGMPGRLPPLFNQIPGQPPMIMQQPPMFMQPGMMPPQRFGMPNQPFNPMMGMPPMMNGPPGMMPPMGMFNNPFMGGQGMGMNAQFPFMQPQMGQFGQPMQPMQPINQKKEGDLGFFEDFGTAQQNNLLADDALKEINQDNPLHEKHFEDLLIDEDGHVPQDNKEIGTYELTWALDEGETDEEFSQPKYLSQYELQAIISRAQPIDPLYLIKWKNQSYTESTYEPLSLIHEYPGLIYEFEKANKSEELSHKVKQRNLKKAQAIIVKNQSLNEKTFKKNREKQDENEEPIPLHLRLRVFRDKLFPKNQKFDLYDPKVNRLPTYKQGQKLKPYQITGVNWLVKSWHENRNIVLADEMGLGKTIQSLGFLHYLHQENVNKGPFLIVAPLTTLDHWK